jgi:hypothetical protein
VRAQKCEDELDEQGRAQWLCTSTGFAPAPHQKRGDFFTSAAPPKFKNARNTQLRVQIRLCAGWDHDNNEPICV